MSPRPKILDELGRELVRAARAAEAGGARGGIRARTPRAFVIGLLALLGLAAAAAAATLIIGRGAPIPAARSGDVPLELRPVAGSARLNGLDVADPDGGPIWDVRTSRSRTGAVCTTVGQVLDGQLGLLGLDRRFRALPAGAADTCSTPQRRGATLAGARAFRGGGQLSALTVVNGVAAPAVRRAIVVAGGRSVRMRLGPGHAFLAVFRGLPEQLRPRVVLTDGAGDRTTLRFADRGEFIAADPSGGAPWALEYSVGADGLRCVAAQRQRGPDSPLPIASGAFNISPSSVPPRCAPKARAFVAIRRFVPRDQRIGRSFWWGLNPARTVVWGAVSSGTRSVVLSGAGAPQRITVDARRGGFLAVLSGHVDPRALHVSAAGRQLDPTAGTGTKGQVVAPAPVPPWRSVASVAPRAAIAEPYATTRGSVAIGRRAPDPTGGPAWALRSWSARISPRVRVSGGDGGRDLLCFAIGVERGDRLVEPQAGGATRTVGTGVRDGRCNAPDWLSRHAAGAEVRTYVDDPEAPDPKPSRIVISGLLGDGIRSAELLGAGAPRPLDLGRHGTFLLVLGPEHAGAAWRVREVRANGRVQTSPSPASEFGIECRARRGQSMRVADPDGGQSWVAGIGDVVQAAGGPVRGGGGHGCRYVGRAVGDRLGSIVEGDAWLRYGIDGFSGAAQGPAGNPMAAFADARRARSGGRARARSRRSGLAGAGRAPHAARPHGRLGPRQPRRDVDHVAHAARRAHDPPGTRRRLHRRLRRPVLRRRGAGHGASAGRRRRHTQLPGHPIRLSDERSPRHATRTLSPSASTRSPRCSWRPRRRSTSPLTRTNPSCTSARAAAPDSARPASLSSWPSRIISSLIATSRGAGLMAPSRRSRARSRSRPSAISAGTCVVNDSRSVRGSGSSAKNG